MEIVTLYHGTEEAKAADDFFIQTFSQRKQPVEAEEVAIPGEAISEGAIGLAQLITALGLAASNGKAKDLMKAGSVALDGEKVTDLAARFSPAELDGKVLRVGKHQFRKLKA
jgi:tyrosyl-tRNA synthetase